jgi:hypothetical protein
MDFVNNYSEIGKNFLYNETYSAVCPILAGFKVPTLISFNTTIITLPANEAVTFVASHQLLVMHEENTHFVAVMI